MGTQSMQKQPILRGATEEERNPRYWPDSLLEPIDRLLQSSLSRAGKALRETFGRAERQMNAREFVEFWNNCRLKAMATTGAHGAPHIAPVHAEFVNGILYSTIYVDAQRRRDLDHNPRVALTTWGADGAVAIVYGRAAVVPGSERESRPGASGQPRRTVLLQIDIQRIYAMKGRSTA
ncbi:MAG: pyridoxamine 5'-phosphate oxidase family protein [Candidatus Binatia bacterium]|nr:pyridoxamine 5'-phosphate oxidase family protein [Candidatus Binatia bacterium]